MGHFGGKPDSEGRAGADISKRMKERRMGRDDTKAPLMHSIAEQKRRLNALEQRYSISKYPHTREVISKEYANLAASLAARCKTEVFSPTEIQGIERFSDLSDPEIVWTLDNKGSFPGPRPDFLPLHHFVKLISVQVGGGVVAYSPCVPIDYTDRPSGITTHAKPADKFIYMLGSSSNDNPNDLNARNLRGLEYFLLTFSHRMTEGTLMQVEINGRRIQVPHGDEKDVKTLRRTLDKVSIGPADHYVVKRIVDGNFRIQTPLYIVSEQRQSYKREGLLGMAVLSYATTVPPQKKP